MKNPQTRKTQDRASSMLLAMGYSALLVSLSSSCHRPPMAMHSIRSFHEKHCLEEVSFPNLNWVPTLLSVSHLSTGNLNFIFLYFLEHSGYFICFHSRYTSQYTVPYNSLAVHNVFQPTSCTYPVQTQGI